MPTLKDLEIEIKKLKQRNKRVEAAKAWETSPTRKLLICGLTYIVIVLFFYSASLPKPFINSIVPTLGFFLSTLSIPKAKTYWVQRYKK
ncbi:hypothetical protein HOH51_03510 [bacterium]|jgi:hypothetical protein|nr:hypothetical protein [bacterium]